MPPTFQKDSTYFKNYLRLHKWLKTLNQSDPIYCLKLFSLRKRDINIYRKEVDFTHARTVHQTSMASSMATLSDTIWICVTVKRKPLAKCVQKQFHKVSQGRNHWRHNMPHNRKHWQSGKSLWSGRRSNKDDQTNDQVDWLKDLDILKMF